VLQANFIVSSILGIILVVVCEIMWLATVWWHSGFVVSATVCIQNTVHLAR